MLVAKTKGVCQPALMRLRFFHKQKSQIFLFLWVLGMGYVILLWHSLSLPYNYFSRLITKLSFEESHHNDMLEC